ncbi:MAG TPA: transporter substrate-binding domain-containing protein [Rhodopila sp.]|nr:transporter substrate-binding domain-containing protein [Rhodopila sp.]
MPQRIPVGLLYSQTGFYGAVGRQMLNGALLGINQINALNPGFQLQPLVVDPGGDPGQYYRLCETMLRHQGVRHFIGCYTSATRRQVLPLIEGADALLWHAARYEGFESSENVIYVGAAPNQHVVPLARHMIAHISADVYCVGSNYIWTWETNKVMRDLVSAAGGRLLAERLVPMGDTGMDFIIAEIRRLRPPAVFNTLVGESAYSFFQSYHRARQRMDLPPVLSCSLCEPELQLIGAEAGAEHITCSPYFSTLRNPANRRFVTDYRAAFGCNATPFADAEASYVCAMLLGRAVQRAGSAEPAEVRRAVSLDRFDAPQGSVRIDPENNHCFVTPRLARSTTAGTFDVFWQAPRPVKPDPFLVWLDVDNSSLPAAPPQAEIRHRRVPHLRVVK